MEGSMIEMAVLQKPELQCYSLLQINFPNIIVPNLKILKYITLDPCTL